MEHYNSEKNLSLESKGLLSYMLHQTKSFEFNMDIIQGDNIKHGLRKIRKCIKELEDLGYFMRTRCRSEIGRGFYYIYEVNEFPIYKRG